MSKQQSEASDLINFKNSQGLKAKGPFDVVKKGRKHRSAPTKITITTSINPCLKIIK